MDPLSITASIAGVLSLAEEITTKSYRYYKSVKDARTTWQNLAVETSNLRTILFTLKVHVVVASGSGNPEKPLIHSLSTPSPAGQSVSPSLLDTLAITLQKVLMAIEGWETPSTKQRLQWPFREKEIKDYLIDIERYKQSFSLALEADNLYVIAFCAHL